MPSTPEPRICTESSDLRRGPARTGPAVRAPRAQVRAAVCGQWRSRGAAQGVRGAPYAPIKVVRAPINNKKRRGACGTRDRGHARV